MNEMHEWRWNVDIMHECINRWDGDGMHPLNWTTVQCIYRIPDEMPT